MVTEETRIQAKVMALLQQRQPGIMSRVSPIQEWIIMASIAGLAGVLFLIAIVLHKGAGKHPLMLITACTVGCGFITVVLWRYSTSQGQERRQIVLTITATLVAISFMILAGEAIVRFGSVPSNQGSSFLNTTLAPRDWQIAAEWNRELLHRSPSNISYFVFDDLLGWTVGPSRQSTDGLYLSSREGIRSSTVGVSFTSWTDRPRVAIVGDSFTFGLEVQFESTWGKQLEDKSTVPIQVLNFGVDGYGVDQAYLRYHRDVQPWHAELVVLGFINHDLYRTFSIYPFVNWYGWGIPFPKPRFVLAGQSLRLLNTPLGAPENLLAIQAIQDLPFINDDPAYKAEAWEQTWYQHSYLVRFLFGTFPKWPDPSPEFSPQNIATLNGEILKTFAQEVTAQGGIPLIVYFPTRIDFSASNPAETQILLDFLRRREISVVDLTACLAQLPRERLFFQDERRHYTPEGNALVAECLSPIIGRMLSSAAGRPDPIGWCEACDTLR